MRARSLALALIAQALVIVIAILIVVIVPSPKEPDFQAARTIFLPQRELEHRMAVSDFQQVTQPPVMRERLVSSALMPENMPMLPALPTVEFSSIADTPLLDANALLGQSGLMGTLSAATTEFSSISFFGIEDRAERVVILFDISTSVKNKVERAGLSMERIREETVNLIRELNANTLFGLIQHARNYSPFRDYLVAATVENKEAALAWLENEFRTDGMSAPGWRRGNPNGIQSVLEAAFSLDPAPDLLILVSDGDYYRTPPGGGSERVPWREIDADLRRLQEGLPEPARLHFVGFLMRPGDRTELQRLTRLYQGRLREFR